MRITDIYNTLHAMDLVASQVQFSRLWLGRSARYYSHLVAEQREPGLATLVGLQWRVGQLITNTAPSTLRLDLMRLNRDIGVYVERRSITDIRTRTAATATNPTSGARHRASPR